MGSAARHAGSGSAPKESERVTRDLTLLRAHCSQSQQNSDQFANYCPRLRNHSADVRIHVQVRGADHVVFV